MCSCIPDRSYDGPTTGVIMGGVGPVIPPIPGYPQNDPNLDLRSRG